MLLLLLQYHYVDLIIITLSSGGVLFKFKFFAEGQRCSPAEVPPEREENLIAHHFVILYY